MLVRTVHAYSEYIAVNINTDTEVRIYFNGINNIDGGARLGVELVGEKATRDLVRHVTRKDQAAKENN